MNALSHRWMAMLRRWRRAILLASLPAMLASVLNAGACVAMPSTPTLAQSVHTPAAAATAHHHHDTSIADTHAEPELPAPCPHCPFDSGAANTATLDCASIDASGAAPAPTAPPTSPPTSHFVAAAQAIPPLIRAAPPRASPLPTHVPLNLRYCVLLI